MAACVSETDRQFNAHFLSAEYQVLIYLLPWISKDVKSAKRDIITLSKILNRKWLAFSQSQNTAPINRKRAFLHVENPNMNPFAFV